MHGSTQRTNTCRVKVGPQLAEPLYQLVGLGVTVSLLGFISQVSIGNGRRLAASEGRFAAGDLALCPTVLTLGL